MTENVFYLDEDGNSLNERREGEHKGSSFRGTGDVRYSKKNALMPMSLSLLFWGAGDVATQRLIRATLFIAASLILGLVSLMVVISPTWWVSRLTILT